MPKGTKERVYTERLVILMAPDKLEKYQTMCNAIGENRSDHIRTMLENEAELWDANRGQK